MENWEVSTCWSSPLLLVNSQLLFTLTTRAGAWGAEQDRAQGTREGETREDSGRRMREPLVDAGAESQHVTTTRGVQ